MNQDSISAGPKGHVDSDGERIYFECWGDGEAVLFSHGMGGNHAIWYQQVPFFARRYRVVTWDQRGFGLSTSRSGDIGPEPSIRDIEGLLDHLEVDRAYLIGQSMGGWATLGFAQAHPDRTRSVVLADTIGGIFTPEIRESFEAYAEVIASSPRPDQLPLGAHPAVGGQLAADDLARSFLYSQIGGLTDPPSPVTISRLLAETDLTGGLDRLRSPLLFVVGENDPIFPPSLIERASRLVHGSEIAIISDTGHSPYFERPADWNNVVVRFLQRFGEERSDE
jgi:3-oxoadipate enol-lactonase